MSLLRENVRCELASVPDDNAEEEELLVSCQSAAGLSQADKSALTRRVGTTQCNCCLFNTCCP
jgi:hypothetical protein